MRIIETVGHMLLMSPVVPVVALFLTLLPASADAAKGIIVYRAPGCDYFIVSTALGYALLEWYGGHDPNQGDTVIGDFETYGMPEIYDLTAGAETTVWVEDFWLSRTRVIEKYRRKCRLG